MLKQRIIVSLWWLLGVVVAGLLIAAMQQKKSLLCRDIKVEIEGNEGHVFVDEKEITDKLKMNGASAGEKMSSINLQTLETIIKKQSWIKEAELYFDNNQVLQVEVKEREPIARVFTLEGTSFYIDSTGMRLPLSNDYSAHVPMFTSFTSGKKKLSKPDSLLLNDVKQIALYIHQDSFWNAMVSQVVITPQSTFNIIPVVGNQTILFGKADSLSSKFDRLYAFYKQVWVKAGFEKYETLSVEFNGQVVATKRGDPKPTIDSALAERVVTAMRSGVDILKDSSFMIPSTNTAPKTLADTGLNQRTPTAAASLTKNNNTAIEIKHSAVKTADKNKSHQPKAVMPKN